MTIKRAIQKLSWRFSPDEKGRMKSFTPNENDMEALNVIIEYFNDVNEQAVEKNEGFLKLYVWAFSMMCKTYDTTPVDDIPQKELHRLLDMPLDYFIMKFTQHLNDKERNDLMVEAGCIEDDSIFATDQQKKERSAKILELLKNPDNVERFTGNIWEQETVKQNLLFQASQAVIKYNHKN